MMHDRTRKWIQNQKNYPYHVILAPRRTVRYRYETFYGYFFLSSSISNSEEQFNVILAGSINSNVWYNGTVKILNPTKIKGIRKFPDTTASEVVFFKDKFKMLKFKLKNDVLTSE